MKVPTSIIIRGAKDPINGVYERSKKISKVHSFTKSVGETTFVLWYCEKKRIWAISHEDEVKTPAMIYCSSTTTKETPEKKWRVFKNVVGKYVKCDLELEKVFGKVGGKKKKIKKIKPLVFQVPSWKLESSLEEDEHNDELLELLLSNDVTVGHLMDLYNQNEDVFVRTFDIILQRKVIERVTPAVKLKLVAMSVLVKNYELLDYLLSLKQHFGIVEIAKALRLLDAPRQLRQLERKLNKLLAKHGLESYEELQKLRKASGGAHRRGGRGRGRMRGRGRRRRVPRGRNNNDAYKSLPKDKSGKRIPVGKISKINVAIHNLKKDMDVLEGSVSGALQRRFRSWAMTLSKAELEFMLLNFQPTNWKAFADIIHPSPSDFACDYFLPCTYGEPYPEDSICALAGSVTMENIVDVLRKNPELSNLYSYIRVKLECQENTEPGPPMGEMPCDVLDLEEAVKTILVNNKVFTLSQLAEYSREELTAFGVQYRHLTELDYELQNWGLRLRANHVPRTVNNILPDDAKAIIATHAPMEDVLWRYEELSCAKTDEIICERLADENVFDPNHARSNYGKLMERVLTFRDQNRTFLPLLMKHAERRLSEIILPDNGICVAVLGDKSGSMEVAIRSSCVIASLLTVAFNADLKFFDELIVEPPCVPRTVEDTINVVDSIEAKGGTSMAAGLYYYLEKRISLDLLVLVSDEQENSSHKGMEFHQVLHRYQQEVNSDLKVFFVSFLEKNQVGQLAESLIVNNMDYEQFRMDPSRPDTSKFSALLGQISMHSGDTVRRVKSLRKYLEYYWEINSMVADIIWGYQRG